MVDHGSWMTLLGLGVIIGGVILRMNILFVVVASSLITPLLAGKTPYEAVAMLGHYATSARYISVMWTILPLIGLLEWAGLTDAARGLVSRLSLKTPGHVLRGYFILRQISAALGLTSLGGQVQMVRSLIAPMAEEAGRHITNGTLTKEERERLRAAAAATDNVAGFFGEDIFLAVASILLMQAVLEANNVQVLPWQLSVWAIPSAVMALAVSWLCFRKIDRSLRR
ncbi:5-oxoproline transporter, DUF969 family subunit [Acetobacter persici]|uniref:Membrane protein n=1 Tax=Acetobacter persici TaxID=1076596 RepID=A0A6V8IBW8_9PROT|nr:DUF969 family protein [Acetobacter persici]OUI89964.1 hypothetical protein HK19_13090 [Acetobacter persici]GFE94567.1 membrane protein [Acetobacter persici]